MRKKWIAAALCLTIILSAFAACKKDDPAPPTEPATASEPASKTPETTSQPETTTETTTQPTTQKLTLSIACNESKKAILPEKATGKMQASFNKAGAYDPAQVKWQSSAPAVMTIDEQGNYQAMGIGKTTITATYTLGDETVTQSAVLDVQKLLTGAVFSTKSIELQARSSADIGASPVPADATDPSIYWGSSNSKIAAIEGNKLVAYRQGNCVLTAYNNRGEALGDVAVNVLPAPVYGADMEFGNQIVAYPSTYSNKPNRTTNLKIAAGKINGTVVAPGGYFSFNEVVGERTRAAGYLDAPIYIGDKEGTGLAGGICQVSSTLFNAVLLSNAKIEKRAQHSLKAPYVPLGQDAAVEWPGLDFAFTNTLDVPIKLVFEFDEGNRQIICRIFTPGTESYALPNIKVESGGSGNSYWMKRYVNGQVNYQCNSTYLNKD